MSWFGNALLAALCWGFAPLFEKLGLRGSTDPSIGVFARSVGVLLGTALMIPFFSNLGGKIAATPVSHLIYIGIGGILASVIGQTFFYRALKAGEVSRAVSVGASYPVIAFLLGLIVFREPLTVSKGLGVFLTVIGISLLR